MVNIKISNSQTDSSSVRLENENSSSENNNSSAIKNLKNSAKMEANKENLTPNNNNINSSSNGNANNNNSENSSTLKPSLTERLGDRVSPINASAPVVKKEKMNPPGARSSHWGVRINLGKKSRIQKN